MEDNTITVNFQENQKKKFNAKEYAKKYREENREYYLDKIKEWKDKNKEKNDTYIKAYYEKNKSKILERQLEKIECIYCNKSYYRSGLSSHNRTDKHVKNKAKYEKNLNSK